MVEIINIYTFIEKSRNWFINHVQRFFRVVFWFEYRGKRVFLKNSIRKFIRIERI